MINNLFAEGECDANIEAEEEHDNDEVLEVLDEEKGNKDQQHHSVGKNKVLKTDGGTCVHNASLVDNKVAQLEEAEEH